MGDSRELKGHNYHSYFNLLADVKKQPFFAVLNFHELP